MAGARRPPPRAPRLGATRGRRRDGALGPLSTSALRRHGVVYPPNTFLQLPLLEAARGGTLLSGFGGDELFATWRWRQPRRRARPAPPPVALDPLRLGYAASPGAPAGVARAAYGAAGGSLAATRGRSSEAMRLEARGARRAAAHVVALGRLVRAPPLRVRATVEPLPPRGGRGHASWSIRSLDPALPRRARAGRRPASGSATGRAPCAPSSAGCCRRRCSPARRRRATARCCGAGDARLRGALERIQPRALVDPEVLRRVAEAPPHEDSAMLLHAAWLASRARRPGAADGASGRVRARPRKHEAPAVHGSRQSPSTAVTRS